MNQIATRKITAGRTDAAARYLCEVILRSHRGRWPTWRAYSFKVRGSEIVELAAWSRTQSKRFVVLTWSTSAIGVRMESFATLRAARSRFQSL